MFAKLIVFDGPRSPEFVAAVTRAGRERIMPLLDADPEFHEAHRGSYILQAADGARTVVLLADTEAALARAEKLVSESALLPGEDPALLPAPDRMGDYEVVYAAGPRFTEIDNA